MQTLKEYQKAFSTAAAKKFPINAKWNQKDRVLSIQRQLADVGGALQKEEGIYTHDNHAYNDTDHRIAALIADILILVDSRGFDIDTELAEVLKWYQD